MVKVLNIGSLNIDYVYNVPHIIIPGETLSSSKLSVFAGGKGLNQSVALSRANAKTFHAGAIGKTDSKVLVQLLKSTTINTDYLYHNDCPSGHTIIQVDTNGQNSIILFGGANHTLTYEQIDRTLDNFQKGDYLIVQNETNLVDYIISKGYQKGLEVCFNVSPYNENIKNIDLNQCAYLIVNEIEGAALAQCDVQQDGQIIAEKLSSMYKNTNIVLTQGTRGSIFKGVGRACIYQECYKVKAIDTTAAGDTFLGYFIASISEGIEPKVALKRASAASAIAVTKEGAAPSIPMSDEVEEFLRNH